MVTRSNGGQAAQVVAMIAAPFVAAMPRGPRVQPRQSVDAQPVGSNDPGKPDL